MGKLAEVEMMKQTSTRKEEGNLINKIINMRNSHLPLEFLVDKNGKRLMDDRVVRAMKSRISLKLPLAAVDKVKQKMKP